MSKTIVAVQHHQPESQGLDSSQVHSLQVQVASQTLKVIFHNGRIQRYRVSSAKKGCSNVQGSLGTPTGWHVICEKIGAEQPLGMVFVARQASGRIAEPVSKCVETGEDLITSRILWLDGLEPGINKGGEVDSKSRYIYIHGTHEEGYIGTPVSHGCIRMRNSDVIDLFALVGVGTRVLISKS